MTTAAEIALIISARDQASGALKQLGGNLGGMAATATAAAKAVAVAFAAMSAGIIAAGGSAVSAAAGFEEKMSGIKAVSGATGAEMKAVQSLALQLGKDTAFSAKEAAAGIEELIKGGLSIPDVLNGAAKSMLDLAAAGGVSLPEAAEISANALAIFALKGEDMARVADLIAGAANASSLSVSDFRFSLAASGAIASQAGQSFDDLAQAIAVMGEMGLKGTDAGTSLKTFLMNLQPTTDKAMDAMMKLGIVTEDGSNKFINANGSFRSMAEIAGILQTATQGLTDAEKTMTLETIFGSDAIRAASIFANQGAGGFAEMAGAMGKVTAAAVGAERLNNLNGSIEQLKGSLETAAIALGMALLPAVRGVVDAFTNLVNAAIPWVESVGPGISDAFGGIVSGAQGLLAAVQRLAGGVFDGVLGFLRVVIADAPGASERLGAFGAMIRDNVLGAIDRLAPTGERLAALFSAVRDAVASLIPAPLLDLVNGLADTARSATAAWNPLDTLADAINAVSGATAGVIGFIKDHTEVQAALVGVLAIVGVVLTTMAVTAGGHAVALGVATAATGAMAVAQGALNAVMTLNPFVAVALLLVGLAAALIYAYQTSDTFRTTVNTAFGSVKEVVTSVVDAVKGQIDMLVGLWQISDVLQGAVEDLGRAMITGLITGIDDSVGWLQDRVTEVVNSIPEVVRDLLGIHSPSAVFFTVGQQMIEGIIGGLHSGGVEEAVTSVVDAVKGQIDMLVGLWQISDVLQGAIEDLGRAMITGLITGINDRVSWLRDRVTEVINSIPEAVRNLLGIHSPSAVFFTVGQQMIEGIIGGLHSRRTDFIDAVGEIATSSVKLFEDIFARAAGPVSSSSMVSAARAAELLPTKILTGGPEGSYQKIFGSSMPDRFNTDWSGQGGFTYLGVMRETWQTLASEAQKRQMVESFREIALAFEDLGQALPGDLSILIRHLANNLSGPFRDAMESLIDPTQIATRSALKQARQFVEDAQFAQQLARTASLMASVGQQLPDAFRGMLSAIGGATTNPILSTVISQLLQGVIPGFAAGGVVPGALGQPMLAMVHGGETVVPPGAGGIDYGALGAALQRQPIILQIDGETVTNVVRQRLLRLKQDTGSTGL